MRVRCRDPMSDVSTGLYQCIYIEDAVMCIKHKSNYISDANSFLYVCLLQMTFSADNQ